MKKYRVIPIAEANARVPFAPFLTREAADFAVVLLDTGDGVEFVWFEDPTVIAHLSVWAVVRIAGSA